MQSFYEAMALEGGEKGVFQGSLDGSWYQGRAGFGGVVAAAMVRAMQRSLAAPEFGLKALGMSFCAPVLAEPFEVKVEVVRRGSSVINVLARLVQAGEVKTLGTGAFGRWRESDADFAGGEMPQVPGPQEVPTVPFNPLFPKFAQHFEYKFCYGGIPYSGGEEASVGGWCRVKEFEEPLDQAHAVALLDIGPPAILSRGSQPRPSATVSWQVVFTEELPRKGAKAGEFLLVTVETERCTGGFAEERATLWSEEGRCLARALQSVAIFG